ncbi:putative Glycosyl transferase, group 1 [Vibrio nigripulchritudo SOn1]|uniref:Glycosyl transferase, group 1 n=1 Tax=Vibrio nigripulchritudo SOn1 TaxID=1238450 RepID=A0AAV2VUB4_9VIBR|nr:glycosyltransferase [Vibrio nigripulchritudo]CCO48260.1 putative Glycosyl transferase, group 1 [Vibrio nigripulchritudo SOn1]
MVSKIKVTIISPVHKVDDIRIYKKQAASFLSQGYTVSAIAKKGADSQLVFQVFELCYKRRISRFLSIPKLIYIAWKEDANIYHIHNPDTLPIGLVLKLFGKTVIYDTHENFRKKILLRQWIPRAIRGLVANSVFYVEKLFSHCFDATIVTQKEQLSDFARSYLIGNSPILDREFSNNTSNPLSSALRLVYVGGISQDRGLNKMLELCSIMNSITPTELYLIGPTINSMSEQELSLIVGKLNNVFYEGVLDQKSAFKIVNSCDYGLILLEDVADYRDTNPNKLFEYMMLSTPFVASDFLKWKELLSDINAGFFIQPKDINIDFARKLINLRYNEELYQEMSNSGVDFVKNVYNWNIYDEPKLLGLYKKLLGT